MISLIESRVSRASLNGRGTPALETELELIGAAFSIVEERLSLRQEYLSGSRTARHVELADMRFSVKRQRETAVLSLSQLRPQLDRMRDLVENGLATRSEARSIEMQFRAAEWQLELSDLEMQFLESKLADPSGQ